jgi:hypothetical protein
MWSVEISVHPHQAFWNFRGCDPQRYQYTPTRLFETSEDVTRRDISTPLPGFLKLQRMWSAELSVHPYEAFWNFRGCDPSRYQYTPTRHFETSEDVIRRDIITPLPDFLKLQRMWSAEISVHPYQTFWNFRGCDPPRYQYTPTRLFWNFRGCDPPRYHYTPTRLF